MTELQIFCFSLILFFLILLAAFFACAETGLMAVNRYRLRHRAQMQKRYAVRILHLLKRPDRLLATILIGSTFATMMASSLATLLAHHLWGEKGAVIAAIGLTLVILVFAEIAPKTLAALYPERVSRLVLYPIYLFLYLFYPVVWVANFIVNSLLRLARVQVTGNSVEPLSREELRSVVYDTAGRMSRRYQHMLLGILDLNKLSVDDVMIPRHDIMGIDIDQPWAEVVERIQRVEHEWVPIYRESINQIEGVLFIRDLPRILFANNTLSKQILMNILHEPYFIPEGTLLHVQLDQFQQTQKRMAFVVDEYGEMVGLVTVEDILEEIVGELSTNIAVARKRVERQSDGSYLIDGTISVREFNRVTQWELPVTGPRTLNGLIVEYLEAMPRPGVAIRIAGYPIEIIEVKENRISLARLFPRRS